MHYEYRARAEEAVRFLIEFIGEDADRQGLQGTPERVIRSYAEIYSGYDQDPKDIFTTFDEPCDQMVVMKGINFFSTCEHHMLPFTGVAHVAYLPNGKVIGASKLVRLVEIFSRRLQIQERLTQQVVNALMEHLMPHGAACIMKATHWCMACRGVRQQPEMITTALSGIYHQEGGTAKAELMALIGEV